MIALPAFILWAAVATAPAADAVKPLTPPATEPSLVSIPKGPNGLTLYNAKGEVVARCDKDEKTDAFGHCKMEPGYTLDDLMNAWVHAYEDLAK